MDQNQTSLKPKQVIHESKSKFINTRRMKTKLKSIVLKFITYKRHSFFFETIINDIEK